MMHKNATELFFNYFFLNFIYCGDNLNCYQRSRIREIFQNPRIKFIKGIGLFFRDTHLFKNFETNIQSKTLRVSLTPLAGIQTFF